MSARVPLAVRCLRRALPITGNGMQLLPRLPLARPRHSSARALRPAERATVLAHLHGERFQDRSPTAVYATLLDEGEYHCSIRTMYRLLEQRERIARTPRSVDPSALQEAGTAGHRSFRNGAFPLSIVFGDDPTAHSKTERQGNGFTKMLRLTRKSMEWYSWRLVC